MRVKAGRVYDESENGFSGEPVLVVNEALVRKYCPTENIIGKITGTVQRKDGPNDAPTAAYVPMAAGSSSDAPVIRPKPKERKLPFRGGSLKTSLARSLGCRLFWRRSRGGMGWAAMGRRARPDTFAESSGSVFRMKRSSVSCR